jgi:hypothetical protein
MSAIIAVRNKEMGLLQASKVFEVPKLTLKDKVKSKEQSIEKLVNIRISRKPVLPEDLENALVSYCPIMEKQFLDLLPKMSREWNSNWQLRMAFPTHLLAKTKKAGWRLFHNFMRRHPQLSLRKPQPTSAARANGFTPENVLKFFDIYEALLEKIQFSPHRLYNSDETGLSVVQHKVCRVVSL